MDQVNESFRKIFMKLQYMKSVRQVLRKSDSIQKLTHKPLLVPLIVHPSNQGYFAGFFDKLKMSGEIKIFFIFMMIFLKFVQIWQESPCFISGDLSRFTIQAIPDLIGKPRTELNARVESW